MVGINEAVLLWVGPSTQAELESDFRSKFSRDCPHPRTLMQAPPEEILEEYEALAEKRGFRLDPAQSAEEFGMSLVTKIAPPGAAQRMREWMEVKEQLGADFFVADLDQHPRGVSCHLNQHSFPVLLTHGTLLVAGGERPQKKTNRRSCLGMGKDLCSLKQINVAVLVRS